MTKGRRLLAVGVILTLAAVICYSHVLGEPARDRDNERWRAERDKPLGNKLDQFSEELAASKFAKSPTLTYRTPAGETLFALQIKPELARGKAGPRDYVVVIDTSASQARGPLAMAEKLTEALVARLGADDRIAILTANVRCKDLTRGLRPAAGAQEALTVLKEEYPAGATNLKEALHKAIKTFDKADRQQVLLFMGDGFSLRDPITPEQRAELTDQMAGAHIVFYPVPLGTRLDPQTLHGFATATGGAPVRVLPGDRVEDTMTRLDFIVGAPVLYPESFQLEGDVTESFPTKLPPVRGDQPTLVVGKIKGGDKIGWSIAGTVDGNKIQVAKVQPLQGHEDDNFFLVSMVDQWRADKDAPALIRADRALAYASETNQLARADLIAQAEWALGENRWDAAAKLFEQATKLDPHDVEAKAGLEVVERLRQGKVTPQQLRDQFRPKADDTVVRINKADRNRQGNDRFGRDNVKVTRERLLALGQAEPRKPDAPVAPADAPADILKDAKQRQVVEDQRTQLVVEEAIRQAGRILRSDPDSAHDQLKRTLDGVRNNPDLSEGVRRNLASRLEATLRSVDTQGARIKADLQDLRNRLVQQQTILNVETQRLSTEERIRARMRVFHNLMDEARQEEAQRQANDIRQDLTNQGLPVPPAVTSGYIMAEIGGNLAQIRELVRIREDRWMATLLQVEKSAIPFPDEPPVSFPPIAAWKAMSKLRKERYESSGLGEDTPLRTLQLRDQLSQPVKFKGFEADPKMTLQEALDHLADRYDLTFEVNENAFKAEMVEDVLAKPVAEKAIPAMINVSLETVLRKILSRVPSTSGTTYIIRRDVIEITTGAYALADKTIRVYPVADLVIPIPSAFNASAVSQGSILGLGGIGAMGGGLGALGGGLGALGGGLGALGGGLGALGGGLGALGGGGLGAMGGGLGNQGGVIGQLGGGANQGFGGGQLGFGGGQLGQLGNLGGQFGLQGGNQSNLLVALIRQVIGTPRDWAPLRGINVIGQPNQNNQQDDPNSDPLGNDLGFFPPAMALVVKGTSRIHTRSGAPLLTPNAPPGGMGRLINGKEPKVQVAGAGDHQDDKDPKGPRRRPPMAGADPRTIWKEALAKGVDDPGLIIATADYMVEAGEFGHAAEFLKANLRQGIVVRPWVYEALAVALRESKAAPEEVERAEMSAADLEPLDARGFIKASQALAENKQYSGALAFCRQAALLEPNQPQAYQSALRYATQLKDTEALEWAGVNLLRRDWPASNEELHTQAKQKLADMAKALDPTRKDAAERLRAALARNRERDIAIRLTYMGQADLDLKVQEPANSICSWLNRQTVGGGTLIDDTLRARPAKGSANEKVSEELYVASQAFPGEYKITVDTVWGRPLGGKAKVEIVQHQGTPRETVRVVTVNLDEGNTFTVKLDEGRRTELAAVPPPEATKRPETEKPASEDVFSQLRSLTDPSEAHGGLCGDIGSLGRASESPKSVARLQAKSRDEQIGYQTRVSPYVGNSADATAQATISADRRSVRLSLSPVFNTVGLTQQQPFVNNPLIPGGRPGR